MADHARGALKVAESLKIGKDIYMVGGPDLTDSRDALSYLIVSGREAALVDCGAGPSYMALLENIRATGYDPEQIKYIIATHAHIDHIGGLVPLKQKHPSLKIVRP